MLCDKKNQYILIKNLDLILAVIYNYNNGKMYFEKDNYNSNKMCFGVKRFKLLCMNMSLHANSYYTTFINTNDC